MPRCGVGLYSATAEKHTDFRQEMADFDDVSGKGVATGLAVARLQTETGSSIHSFTQSSAQHAVLEQYWVPGTGD